MNLGTRGGIPLGMQTTIYKRRELLRILLVNCVVQLPRASKFE